LFQGIETGDEVENDPFILSAVVEAFSSALTATFEVPECDEMVVPVWESSLDACRSLLQNSEWNADLERKDKLVPTKTPLSSAYVSCKRVLPKLSYTSIVKGLHLDSDSKSIETVIKHAVVEIDGDLDRKKVLLIPHFF